MTIDPATEAAHPRLAPTVASVSAERLRDEMLADPGPRIPPVAGAGILERLELLARRSSPRSPRCAACLRRRPSRATPSITRWRPSMPSRGEPASPRGAAPRPRQGHHACGRPLHRPRHGRRRARCRGPRSAARCPARAAGIVGAHPPPHVRLRPLVDRCRRPPLHPSHRRRRPALLFALRRADNVASGVGANADPNQAARGSDREQLEMNPDCCSARLAIDGHDLQARARHRARPEIGAVLERSRRRVLDDPSLNRRPTLLALARQR